MKIDQLVQVNAHTRTKKNYEELGYKEENGFFFIKTDDLLPHSSVQETRICDCCNKKFIRRHEHHEITNKRFNMDLCGDCVKTNKEIKKIVQDKKDETWNIKYGCHPMQLDEVKAKVETSYLEKYGGHPMHNKEVKDKWIKVINNKYGGNSPLCDEEIRSKAINTINELGNIPTSSQQVSIFNLLKQNYPNCSLNYIDGIFALDIMLEVNGQRFDIEYDGKYWHQDEQKDRRRDEVLKSRGYKILRVKAKHKIPTLEQLQEGLEYLNNHDYSQIILE